MITTLIKYSSILKEAQASNQTEKASQISLNSSNPETFTLHQLNDPKAEFNESLINLTSKERNDSPSENPDITTAI
jgi:hypothetical protein